MNLAEHALKAIKQIEIKPVKELPESHTKMLDNKALIKKMINEGGSISTIGKRIGLSHGTVSRYIDKVMGEGTRDIAKANGLHNSCRGLKGKENPKRDLMS